LAGSKNRIAFFILFIVFSIKSAWAQSLNYKQIFGSDWDRALMFVKENKKWIEPKLKLADVSYPVAIAIIFPELVRYSSLRDRIEITLLKALYINLGEEYANFSIGPFQMKPSFAEMIHENYKDEIGNKSRKIFMLKSDYEDIKNYRASIVSDLENPETQLNYLISFIKICESHFNLRLKNFDEKVKFLATAYNYGFWKTAEQIENMTDKKYFRTTILETENYSYSEVSLFWFNDFMNNNNDGK
jgi:hypothetical protein